jgi:aryl-alcohol dehydrogenase-like predicted oxidoreductase
MTKIVLGTANFGNSYGVANKGKVFSQKDAIALVNWAQANGINHFDTALAYQKSETILSNALDYEQSPTIDSKLEEISCGSSKSIVESVRESRNKLGISHFSTIYLHNEKILQSSLGSEIAIGLREILDLGLAKQIGVSVYSQSDLLACKKVLPELSVFQVPENICDRRLLLSTVIRDLATAGNSFIVRSIFLQGLLLMDPLDIPSEFDKAKNSIRALIEFANKNSLTVIELCTAYAHSISWASGIVVGVSSKEQLMEIKKADAIPPLGWQNAVPTIPTEILDPRNWSS